MKSMICRGIITSNMLPKLRTRFWLPIANASELIELYEYELGKAFEKPLGMKES